MKLRALWPKVFSVGVLHFEVVDKWWRSKSKENQQTKGWEKCSVAQVPEKELDAELKIHSKIIGMSGNSGELIYIPNNKKS